MLLISLYLLHSLALSEPVINPFGTYLGSNSGVPGYSNGNDNNSNEDSYVGNIYSGLKWQCVEYARRWLIITQSLTFASVDCASDIWHIDYLSSTSDSSKYIWHIDYLSSTSDSSKHTSLYRIPNGSKCPPSKGDLIIYKRTETNPVGHVAIISKVDYDDIEISEQNWDTDFWPGNYSRAMPLTELSGLYYLFDFEYPIIGWMSYNKPENVHCADIECVTCSAPDRDKDPKCEYL
ncbi:hypothetical protein SteCoe_236 [Stentor coeruleus]|uniref:Peptidase C51 domain-containing protein n=1 Tax=Stentor coeruleus TaxID=5963 RepID=A0A1R2D4R8_9CILI|nr:hypothetical protein SteCoe_236 [Stentor coeruleus]